MFSNTNNINTLESKLETVKFYIDPIKDTLAEKVLSYISGNKLFISRIENFDYKPYWVNKDTQIFTFNFNEDEENQTFKLDINPDFHGINSNIIQSGKDYVAACDGIVVLDNDKPRVVQASFDGSCDVKVSDDSMKVIIDVYPSIGDNPITTSEDIIEKVKQLGVVADIKLDLLNQKLTEVENNKVKFLELCIVEGLYPVNGEDGWLENKTKKQDKIKKLNFDQFYKVNPVISIKEGETIAVVHPPTEGTNGRDIFGNTISPEPGKPVKVKAGLNTKYDEETNTKIISKKDGFLEITEDKIKITDTFTVRGDIDFESGNIIAKGSLKVLGDVKNEFKLELSQDIDIGGYVGDATLEAGGNVTIKGGFLGKGEGILRSEGNVHAKFIENQTVYSRGSLKISKDALNAKLFAKGSIVCNGPGSSIIGGHVIAGDKVEVYNLGCDRRTETIVEVGFDFLKRKSLSINKDEISNLRSKLEEVDKYVLEYAKMKRRNIKDNEKLKLYALEHKKIAAKIDEIKGNNLKLTNEIYVPTSSTISVKGYIYPGVRIGINGRFLKIDEVMKSRTFLLSNDNEIISTHYQAY